jgi:glycosidase
MSRPPIRSSKSRPGSLLTAARTAALIACVFLAVAGCSIMRGATLPAFATGSGSSTTFVAATEPAASAIPGGACKPKPFGKRALFLRGSFNSWNARDAQQFTYHCNRFELITRISGEHAFKLGDENWSKDADFGGDSLKAGVPLALELQGRNLRYTFNDYHRIILDMSQSDTTPLLVITDCPSPPLGEATLFLLGTMNNWTALDDYAFQYRCGAYYLNVKLSNRQEFKIADASWSNTTTFGAPAGAPAAPTIEQSFAAGRVTDAGGIGNLHFTFTGEQTIKLALDRIGDTSGKIPTITIVPKSFAAPTVKVVTDAVALSLRHDTRVLADKSPFGAVTAGTAMEFGLSALPGATRVTLVLEKRQLEGNQEVLEYTEVARVPLRKLAQASGARERWGGRYKFNDSYIYGYYFEAEIAGKTYVYQNNKDAVYWTRENGTNGLGLVSENPETPGRIRRFRQTVYRADFVVPSWAKDAVYYYIFPERFRNGDPSSDPRPGIDTYHDQPVEFHANWLDKPYVPGSGDGSDNVNSNDFFGGDLAGIIEKLDYIADLGANTLYMTPLFTAASNHKYDTADYKNIDPHFGSNADFARLTTEAGKRDIRVILDVSLNHSGSDSIYFDRFSKYSARQPAQGAFEGAKIRPASPYANWYNFDTTQTDPNKQYRGWVGVLSLPVLNKASPEFRNYSYGAGDSVMKLWLDRGAAGWRMDVAPWVPDDFWREWRAAVKGHKPDALTIAETFFDASKFFLGDTFDSTMNYIFRNTVLDYAAGGKAAVLYRNIELMREAYPPQSFYALMNLLSTHDSARSLYFFGYRDNTTDAATVTLAKQRLRLAVFFQMMFPGAPAIYYGDEVGVTGGEDPYNRATYPWPDKGGKPDLALLADFKTLVKMRKDHPVLRHGTIDAPLFVDDHLVVLARNMGNMWAITATNNAAASKSVTVPLPEGAKAIEFLDALTGAGVHAASGAITFTVPALYGTVLVGQ